MGGPPADEPATRGSDVSDRRGSARTGPQPGPAPPAPRTSAPDGRVMHPKPTMPVTSTTPSKPPMPSEPTPELPVDRYGIFRAEHLPVVGLPRTAAYDLARRGAAVRLFPGTFREASDTPHPLHLEAAAQTYARRFAPPGVLTGLRALAVMGIPLDDGLGLDRRVLAGIDVLVGRDERIRLRSQTLKAIRVAGSDIPAVSVRGLAVAPAWRAVADVARLRRVTDEQLRTIVDRARFHGRLRTVAMVADWDAATCKGAARLRRLTRDGAWLHESEGERLAMRAIFGLGGPQPDTQVVVSPRHRVDFFFRAAALVVEYFGEVHRERFQQDHLRSMELHELGLGVIVIAKANVAEAARTHAYVHDVRRARERAIAGGRLAPFRLPEQPSRLQPLAS